MSLYVIIGHDTANSLQKRSEIRPQHIERLRVLAQTGRLKIAGPCPHSHDDLTQGMQGSVMIVDFPSRDKLDNWLRDEPYLVHGVYTHVDVLPFIHALPEH